MTPAQQLVWDALAAADRPLTAREVARRAWPDDPGWHRRTAGRGASSFNGALGGTMPLRAGRVLAALERQGLVESEYRRDSATRWTVTR